MGTQVSRAGKTPILRPADGKFRYYVGIDPGCNTGMAIWDSETKKLVSVETLAIHQAIDEVRKLQLQFGDAIFIRVEDARERLWFGNAGRERLKGAGSICRDSRIWEDFLTDIIVSFEMVAPKRNRTKLDSDTFVKLTGWKARTSEHGRDAALLVFGF